MTSRLRIVSSGLRDNHEIAISDENAETAAARKYERMRHHMLPRRNNLTMKSAARYAPRHRLQCIERFNRRYSRHVVIEASP